MSTDKAQNAAPVHPFVMRSVWSMDEAWTIIDDENQEPVFAVDAAGCPWLLYASRRDAAAGARAHKEIWGIDCHPARVRVTR